MVITVLFGGTNAKTRFDRLIPTQLVNIQILSSNLLERAAKLASLRKRLSNFHFNFVLLRVVKIYPILVFEGIVGLVLNHSLDETAFALHY